MPVVWSDGVVGGRNVVQSKGVGRAASAPFTEEPLSSMRRTIAKRLNAKFF